MNFHDFYVDADRPFSIANYTCLSPKAENVPQPGHIRRIALRNWRGRGIQTANVLENGGGEISGLVLQDIDLIFHGENKEAATVGARSCHDGEPLLSTGFYIQGTQGTKITDLNCSKEGDGLWNEMLRAENSSSMTIDGKTIGKNIVINL